MIGAYGDDSYRGAAYVFRNLDAATGTVSENTKLVASDRVANDYFGTAVSLSKGVALVGAYADDVGANANEGGVYLYRNLGTATGTVRENVKILASDGVAGGYFGVSVSLEDDQFLIGAMHGNGEVADSGKAYTGSVSSLTTLDAGNASRTIGGISFISQNDWVIGQTTDHNQVTLSAGDAGTVSADGKAVYIGQSAGSDDNLLVVEGRLTASELYIGSIAGNEGNILRLNGTAGQFTIDSINLTAGNMLEIEGDYLNTDDLLAFLGEGTLKIWWGSEWLTVNSENAVTSITIDFFSGYTTVQIVPEPATWALIGLGAGL